MLEEVTIIEEKTIVDFKRLSELSNYSEKGLSQLAHLVKNWEYKQANVDRLLREELDNLSKQRQEVKLKQLEIFEEYRFEEESYSGDKRPISILDAIYDILPDVPRRRNDMVVQNKGLEIEAEYDTVIYRKQRAMHLQKLLKASNQREQILKEKLQENIENLERRASPESQDFKREVLERGVPAKREITFETELFGTKTFLIYVEPVFSNAGDTIGVNYMGMDVTDQVSSFTRFNKETMRAKQMLATMSHEIRSPLSGVVSMVEILSTTNLDKEQRQLLSVMLSSGDLVLELINDILDLSKVESGVMKLEAAKFRPREIVKHVIGDVLRIRQILTNLISNTIKFTHEGKVGMKLYVVPALSSGIEEGSNQKITADRSTVSVNVHEQDKCVSLSQSCCDQKGFHEEKHGEGPYKNHTLDDKPKAPVRNGALIDGGEENHLKPSETIVWICCDVYDTGIGIPENTLLTLFKKYMQVGANTVRKYGGTGLGLAIYKQLVELMGGHLSVSSREHHGSTFTFILPYKVSPAADNSDDPDELLDMVDHDAPDDANDDDTSSEFFQFQPLTLGSLFTSGGPGRAKKLSNNIAFNASYKLNGLLEDSYSFPSSNIATKEVTSLEDAYSVDGANTSLEYESSIRDNPDSVKKIAVGSDSEIQCHNKENGKFHNPDMNSTHPSRESNIGETIKAIDFQEASEMWERTNRSTQCSASNSPEIPKSMFKPKILLVEDNKINVMVTQSMMKQLGHTIDVVNNGVEAVHAVQSCTYDLILMDVCMPVMDGLQATRLIRSFEETGSWDAAMKAGIEQFVPTNDQKFESSKKGMPIIAMTANALAESADECFANGIDSFVSKPVTFQKLKECLDQYF
ncbi:Histidine kinase 5 [Camellia lanceoleosa]|uniref:Histidine kinase 5 n=1 Tax=Camellia lanceoleosa TaxID=1840588 RepID=A0ACC0HCE1_9ERIC|nr:Histidine kinase 5 [Camellia lanceoleosa]